MLNLNKDKKVLTEVSEDFKNKYVKTSKDLIEAQKNVPSRTTWFLIGSGTTAIVLALLIGFMAKK